MSLYDDLGVGRGATPEEIRAAHKALARLLHPDRIQDEYTRQLAETTLKKINMAFAVLSDSRRREAYDRELAREWERGLARNAATAAQAEGRPWESGGLARWVAKRANGEWLQRNALWGAATVGGLAVIWLVLWQGPQAARPAGAAMPVAPVAEKQSAKVEGKRRRRAGSSGGERKSGKEDAPKPPVVVEARREPEAVKPGEVIYLPGPQAVKKPVFLPPPEVKRRESELLTPPPEVLVLPPPLPVPVRPGMAGLWVYLKPSRVAAERGSYPPEFIELTLREAGGVVKGRYLARYQVADRAISPEVRFQFEGAVGEEAGEFVWSGNGGAKGEVRLRRVGDHQLHVSWHTTEMGAEAGLSSGTATLIRRQTP